MVGPPVDFKASGPCRLLPIALPHRSDSRPHGYVMKPLEVSKRGRPIGGLIGFSISWEPPPPASVHKCTDRDRWLALTFDIAARSVAVIGDENAGCAPAFLW